MINNAVLDRSIVPTPSGAMFAISMIVLFVMVLLSLSHKNQVATEGDADNKKELLCEMMRACCSSYLTCSPELPSENLVGTFSLK
jgi:hypothetical protein